MKTIRFILKIAGFSLAVLSATCLFVGYWDKIARVFLRINAKMTGVPLIPTEYDDFETLA
ncbi:exported hypothetical protein [uncultured Eubacteriales bacterium]|uniref:Uncharacterized protein n=1 Tax=uncultured Eubacteriales bacterium TaxID=172733 RepID=A0A212KAE5_9FIRM|nr:exported hypothetical protein [uncultured Eubacteriales bacterium]